ncbi:MAG: hypothetical protein HN474_07440 [Nitrospina sp.]|nr:hypothetical protein [Nitrospina sp.]
MYPKYNWLQNQPYFQISKIESIRGVLNLDEIVPVSDQILIYRGDLSREISLEKIPVV